MLKNRCKTLFQRSLLESLCNFFDVRLTGGFIKFFRDGKLVIFVLQPDTFIKETFVCLFSGYFFV